jgi:hypothetical protein
MNTQHCQLREKRHDNIRIDNNKQSTIVGGKRKESLSFYYETATYNTRKNDLKTSEHMEEQPSYYKTP